jgi:hypothetical protein
MKRIYDPAFKYVPSVKTDIRKTFARIRREQAEAQEREAANAATKPDALVFSLPRRTKAGE